MRLRFALDVSAITFCDTIVLIDEVMLLTIRADYFERSPV